jgi:hypothetical protein
METTLAVLMVLGIYVGVPLVIGFAIGGVVILGSRRATRARRAQALGEVADAVGEAIAEAEVAQSAGAVTAGEVGDTRKGS